MILALFLLGSTTFAKSFRTSRHPMETKDFCSCLFVSHMSMSAFYASPRLAHLAQSCTLHFIVPAPLFSLSNGTGSQTRTSDSLSHDPSLPPCLSRPKLGIASETCNTIPRLGTCPCFACITTLRNVYVRGFCLWNLWKLFLLPSSSPPCQRPMRTSHRVTPKLL